MKNDTYVVQPLIKGANKNNPCLLRFVMNEKFTIDVLRIDNGIVWICRSLDL